MEYVVAVVFAVFIIGLCVLATVAGYTTGQDNPNKYGTFVVHCHDRGGSIVNNNNDSLCLVNNTVVLRSK